MKKRFLLTLLALVCALCCATWLTACGDGGGGGGGIYLVRSDGTQLSNGCSLGEFTYMESNGYDSVFDFKVCTKNADGAFADLSEDDVTVTYTDIITDTVMDPTPTSYTDFNAGSYRIDFEYNGSTVTAYFSVNKSNRTNYTVTLSKNEWKYGEEIAAVSVYNGETLLTDDEYSGVYFISVDDYNEIKDDDDFANKLVNKHNSYEANNASYVIPGIYYVHAYCRSTENYNDAYSAFTASAKITVKKGDLTIKNADCLYAEEYRYNNSGKIGNIKLSDIEIKDYDYDRNLQATAVNGYGTRVYGDFVWRNPNTEINSKNSGNEYSVTFVPEEAYRAYYNYTLADAGQVEITVYKGTVQHPRYTNEYYDTQEWTGYGVQWTYDGKANAVGVGNFEYDKYVTVTRGGNKLQVENDENNNSIFDSVTDVGTYVYTLSLKDKDNYCWAGGTDNANLTFTCRVQPIESYMWYMGSPRLVPDRDGNITLKITQFATPYQANTLRAEKSVSEDDHTLDAVTVSIVPSTDDNYNGDYLVIGNIVSHSQISIKFNATGKDGYADIDYIVTYTIDNTVGTSINSETNINVYKGTAASVLYDYYPTLRTTAGDYKLYMKVSGIYYQISDDATLDELGEHEFKLEFDSSNVHDSVTVEVTTVEFKMTCVEFDCPITAGAKINATIGANANDVLANYQLQNSYGQWYFENQDSNGNWTTVIGGLEIPEGETKCRLYFQSNGTLAGKPAPVEFTIVGM